MSGHPSADYLVDIPLSKNERLSATATAATRWLRSLSFRFSRNYLNGCHAHQETSVHASSKLRRSLKGWVLNVEYAAFKQVSFFHLFQFLDFHVLFSAWRVHSVLLDKYGNGITLPSFVLALCDLVFLVTQNQLALHDSHHTDKAN
jgi:hypothetical protein